MRLHRLSLTAFGPFAGTEVIDFDDLSRAGLFLFTGQTGAGKTSVLDGVCFALYGQVPGARHGSPLRSAHAPADLATQVELELTIRGRLFRVARRPAWERPKRRGQGTTTQQAHILVCERLGQEWRTVSTRLDEGGQLLCRLIGLSMTQFCQVVLLPQGQFAEFLRAGGDRRRDLLESLFDTARFAAVESWLVDARRDAARRLHQHDEGVARVLAQIAEVAGLDGPPDDLRPAEAPGWAGELRTESAARWHAAAQADELAAQGRIAAQANLAAAEQLNLAQTRLAALITRRDELLAEAPAVSAIVVELEKARRAAPLVPLWTETVRLEQVLDQAVGQVVTVTKTLAADGEVAAGSLNDEASVRAEAVALREATGALAQLVDEEVRAEQLGEELAEFERTIVALDARSSALAVSVRDSAASAKRLEVEVETARRSQAELPGLEAAVRSAGERLTAGRRRDERTTQLLDQEDMLRHRVDEAQAARQQALDLREKRLLGFAAELAGTLLDGSPCGVCGSIAHPHPAEPRSDAVSEADELAAEAHAVATERRRAEGLALRTETEIGLAEARSLAGEHAVADLVTALAQAEAGHVTARESATARTAVEAKLRRVTGEQETQIQERMSLDAEAQRLRDRTALVQEQLGSLRIQLASARGSDFSVRARMERIEGLATNCESLSDALKTAERVRRDLDDARSRAEIAAAAHGISELGTVAELVRDDGHLAELEEHRARHVGELTSVNEQLTDPVLQQAAAQPRADVRSLRVESERADAEHRRRLGDRHGAEQCAAALARLNRRLDGLVIDRAPLAAHHETVDHLSRLVEGKSADNRLRMSLAAYVLAARLEQVAAAASERLLTMSSGRYSLLHTDAVGTGRAVRGGLHLRVFDAWTGRDRDPTTLSGGESFAASLALALGLADVVTAEAGGSQLETLFVDEGFGSLDEETLDDVMGMLDNLRDGGRVIGIVSHVAELRQRIPTQLQILKGRRGSRIRQ